MNVKSQILLATQKIFLTRGFKNVNMDDLSREMGMSKKTLYLHFKNKIDLILQIIKSHIDHEKKSCADILNTKNNPIQKLINIQKHNYDMLRNMNPIALYELKRYYPQAWAIFEDYKSDFVLNQVVTNYQEGIKAGYYRKDLNVIVIASFHVKSIDILFQIGLETTEMHLGDIFKEYFNYHLRGIATEKGIKEIKNLLD